MDNQRKLRWFAYVIISFFNCYLMLLNRIISFRVGKCINIYLYLVGSLFLVLMSVNKLWLMYTQSKWHWKIFIKVILYRKIKINCLYSFPSYLWKYLDHKWPKPLWMRTCLFFKEMTPQPSNYFVFIYICR